jgi:hypothetical protein
MCPGLLLNAVCKYYPGGGTLRSSTRTSRYPKKNKIQKNSNKSEKKVCCEEYVSKKHLPRRFPEIPNTIRIKNKTSFYSSRVNFEGQLRCVNGRAEQSV